MSELRLRAHPMRGAGGEECGSRVNCGMQSLEMDAVVIGAGAAGLMAGAVLAEAGARVAIVEARARWGGRVRSLALPAWPEVAELGAEFLHGPAEALVRLAEASGTALEPVSEQYWQFEDDRLRPAPDLWERMDAIGRRIGPWYNGSVDEWLRHEGTDLPPADHEQVRRMVAGFHAADPGRMSARTLFAASGADETQRRASGGYSRLLEVLVQRFERAGGSLVLCAPVDEIVWRPGKVEVSSSAASAVWRAKAVIVTVPLGVLQARDASPRFSPPLIEHYARWQRMGWGHAHRILFRMSDDLWQQPLLPAALREQEGAHFGFVQSDQRAFPVWWARAPAPVLVGWWGGPGAAAASGARDEELFEQALDSLSRIVGVARSELERRILDWRLHNWSRDPYSRGAYSFSAAGADLAPEVASQPVEDTLFFAGEAFSTAVELGTVHAAVGSGERAGQAVRSAWERRGGLRREPVSRLRGRASSG